MRAFVTGGTGFVGSHLVDALIESNKYTDVRCLVRKDEKWLTGKAFTKVPGDLFDLQTISEALTDVDVIFHVAGLVRAQKWSEFKRANVDATENLIRIAQKKGVTNLVILSSLAATGPSNGTPLNESAQLKPVSMYGESKMAMEKVIHQTAGKKDSIKIIRPPAVFGPRESDIYTIFKTMKFGIFPMSGDGNHPKLSMVYVSDLIDGIMASAERKNSGIHTYFLGGSKDAYSWNQIREISSIVLGIKTIPIKLKPAWVKKIAIIVEKGASIFGKYPPLNEEKANEMVHEWVCSSEKAKQEIDYQPSVTLEEGISRTIRWYKNHNWL
jgi:nucleoside-diphosphate-sugar epimerase